MLRYLLMAIAVAACQFSLAAAQEPGWDWLCRQIEPTGQYYLAITRPKDKNDPRRAVTLAERKRGSSPVLSRDDLEGVCLVVANLGDFIGLRQGDAVHGRVVFSRQPTAFAISPSGQGFVALLSVLANADGASVYSGSDAIATVSRSGEIVQRKNLGDLFAEDVIAGFGQTDGCLRWLKGAWLDEARGQLIVLGNAPTNAASESAIRLFDLQTGNVSIGSPEVALTAIQEMNEGALVAALDLAADLQLGAMRADAIRVLDDDELPLRTRLHAAAALAAIGDSHGAQLIKDAIGRRKTNYRTDVVYAVVHAPAVLGTAAIPMLRQLLIDPWEPRGAIEDAFVELGPAAVPALIDMLGDTKHSGVHSFALATIARFGPAAKQAVPRLLTVLRNAERAKDWHAGAAVARALAAIGPDAKTAVGALRQFALGSGKHLRYVQGQYGTPSYESNLRDAQADFNAIVTALAKICRQ